MCLDGDESDVFIEDRVRARKPYLCEECGGPIPVGFHYIRVKTLDDGEWSPPGYQHVECAALWAWVQRELCGNIGLRYVGGLREECREYDDANIIVDDNDAETREYEPRLEEILDSIAAGYERAECEVLR